MLAQAARAEKSGEGIVFLGWEPHPMNKNLEMTYLTGGDDFFGPNLGGATVYTNVRKGFAAECPNVGKFLQNLVFSLDMENEIMGDDPRRRRGSGRRGGGLAEGQPGRARRLARRGDDAATAATRSRRCSEALGA